MESNRERKPTTISCNLYNLRFSRSFKTIFPRFLLACKWSLKSGVFFFQENMRIMINPNITINYVLPTLLKSTSTMWDPQSSHSSSDTPTLWAFSKKLITTWHLEIINKIKKILIWGDLHNYMCKLHSLK